MRILTSPPLQVRELQPASGRTLGPVIVVTVAEILALLASGAVVAAIVLVSAWAAGLGADPILGAATWGAGFVFFGAAVDNRGRQARLQLATGAALLALAWLQYSLSPAFTFLTGMLLAAWAGASLFRQLR